MILLFRTPTVISHCILYIVYHKTRAVKQYIGAQYIGIIITIIIIIIIIGKKANILIIDYWQICYIVLQYIGPILVIVY